MGNSFDIGENKGCKSMYWEKTTTFYASGETVDKAITNLVKIVRKSSPNAFYYETYENDRIYPKIKFKYLGKYYNCLIYISDQSDMYYAYVPLF